MFELSTQRARQVVVLAQDEARALRHNYIGTEHILLGLLREEHGLAARVLASLEITIEGVHAKVAGIAGQGDEVATGQLPFTPRAKNVLELALREARTLGHDYIGTEHILLGLVHGNDGVAARILLDFDADAETIRNEIIRMLSSQDARPNPGGGSGSSRSGKITTARPRFTRASDRATTRPPRFTRGARKVLILAQDEARALKHTHMGTEYILLGLLREEHGLAARLLDTLEITLDDVRAQVVRIAGQGDEVPTGHIRFTPGAQERARPRATRSSLARPQLRRHRAHPAQPHAPKRGHRCAHPARLSTLTPTREPPRANAVPQRPSGSQPHSRPHCCFRADACALHGCPQTRDGRNGQGIRY
jgi:ATP-dependent Clp protease ATP-binding subunit ClpA